MFCTNCGTELSDNQSSCPVCGAPVRKPLNTYRPDDRQDYGRQGPDYGQQQDPYRQGPDYGQQQDPYRQRDDYGRQGYYQQSEYGQQNQYRQGSDYGQQGYYQQSGYGQRNNYQESYYQNQRNYNGWNGGYPVPAGAGTNRNIALCIIFSIITCGIYGLYWMVMLNDEVSRLAGEEEYTSGLLVIVFSIITCGIYALYWYYRMGERIDRIRYYQGDPSSSSPILYLILALVGLSIINDALMQDTINNIVM